MAKRARHGHGTIAATAPAPAPAPEARQTTATVAMEASAHDEPGVVVLPWPMISAPQRSSNDNDDWDSTNVFGAVIREDEARDHEKWLPRSAGYQPERARAHADEVRSLADPPSHTTNDCRLLHAPPPTRHALDRHLPQARANALPDGGGVCARLLRLSPDDRKRRGGALWDRQGRPAAELASSVCVRRAHVLPARRRRRSDAASDNDKPLPQGTRWRTPIRVRPRAEAHPPRNARLLPQPAPSPLRPRAKPRCRRRSRRGGGTVATEAPWQQAVADHPRAEAPADAPDAHVRDAQPPRAEAP